MPRALRLGCTTGEAIFRTLPYLVCQDSGVCVYPDNRPFHGPVRANIADIGHNPPGVMLYLPAFTSLTGLEPSLQRVRIFWHRLSGHARLCPGNSGLISHTNSDRLACLSSLRYTRNGRYSHFRRLLNSCSTQPTQTCPQCQCKGSMGDSAPSDQSQGQFCALSGRHLRI